VRAYKKGVGQPGGEKTRENALFCIDEEVTDD